MKLRSPALCLALAAMLAPSSAQDAPHARAKAGSCDSLDSIPINQAVDYATQVRPLFGAYGCIGCHDDLNGPDALDLSGADFSELCALVGVDAQADSSLKRVDPGAPRRSLLFQKISCAEVPGFLGRMPPFGTTVAVADQALVYDWIAQGAKGNPGTDCTEPLEAVQFDGFESTRP
jgi:hypothetical protein